MSIFAVNFTKENEELAQAIKTLFPEDHHEINSKAWLVAFQGTPKELSGKLEISEGRQHGGVVLQVSAYYGRASPNLWSWIKAKWESSGSD